MSNNETVISGDANKPLARGIALCIGVITLCLNTFSWTIIVKGKLLAKQHKICFSGLLITDTLLGLQVTMTQLIPFEYNTYHVFCKLRLFMGSILVFASCQTNILITTERFIRIYSPLIAKKILTCKRLGVGLVSIWLMSASLTFGIFHKEFSKLGGDDLCQYAACTTSKLFIPPTAVVIFISFLGIMGMYMYIMKETRRNCRQIALTFVGENVNKNIFHLTKAERRSNATVGIIVAVFGISYLPIGIGSLYFGIDNRRNRSNDLCNRIIYPMLCFMMFNSMINPIIYIWRLKSSRQEALKWLSSCFGSSDPRIVT